MTTYVDLPPMDSLHRAQQDVSRGIEDAWDALDRHFRWLVVDFLQNRVESSYELEGAIIEASYWAEREDRIPYRYTWSYLLELLTNAETQPSLAEGLQAVEGRAAEMLAVLVRHAKPLRPTEVSERMGLTIQQISNLGNKLEKADLIIRRRSGGKATWMWPTSRGLALAEKLSPATRDGGIENIEPAFAEEPFWFLPAEEEAA